MDLNLDLFKQDDLFESSLTFFRDILGLQLQTKSKMPIDLKSQFETFGIKSKKVEEVWNHVDKTYYIGLLDDNNFEKEITEQEKSDLKEDLEEVEQSDDEYPGILIFAIDLNDGFNPTRSNLTEINRTLNRFSQRVPALVLARYGNKVSLMLADRVAYKQEWREGEKVRKVSLLRDIDLDKPHAGHLRILKDLVVPTSGTKKVDSFDGLYKYWKEVLDTSELNKKFYQDLSNWYFWAIKHVRFPDEPTAEDAHNQDKERDDMLQEHRATNVIRLLTRLLFVWFIKEKGLIPEELFDLKTLQQDILKEITPYHETGMFKEANKESIYYKAILQNLFFATLNCPIEASSSDDRERGFRSTTRGVHFGVTYLMRYEQYFKEKEKFLDLVNSKVPFLNGGLFECLDERGAKEDKEDRVWVDGFSDNLPKEHKLIVPDFLFFGVEEEVDLSEDYGLKSKKYKEAAVRGLLNIFNSYKFTITENTPIEEDVALDPELLGKVFENLLASYNPETKTTARKQTGSFYTPREIVNYMVDESLIAYLKKAIMDCGISEKELDEKLHQLTSYEETVPFEKNEKLRFKIITALSNCNILDPACGSGAFPMGILQKMVHILQKLDTNNGVWKEVQKEKASKEADRAISEIKDKEERGQRLQEINEAFDERMNAPDYARKLFLIENCIYGVDIQPVATQISKLRFFISLVVEQKVGENKSDNFGIRPLPNLETKFVTANTLIDIKDNSNQASLYETEKIKKLEAELKQVRSKLFSARTTDTKYKYRQEDERLRNEIADELKQTGWPNDAADKLASWDPYDQNASSPFFNPEWMFDISGGFDLVIGNPPYASAVTMARSNEIKSLYKRLFPRATGSYDIFILFLNRTIELLNSSGKYCWIIPNKFLVADYAKKTKEYLLMNGLYKSIDVSTFNVFENASVYPIVIHGDLSSNKNQFQEYLLEKYTDLEIRKFKEPIKLSDHSLIKDYNIKIGSGATGFEAKKIKSTLFHKSSNDTIPFTVSGCIDPYTISNENVRFMGLKLDNAYVKKSNKISDSKWQFWLSPKIVIAGMTKEIEAVYTEDPFGLGVGVYAIYDFKGFDPYYLTSILNSTYITFYLKNKFKDKHLAGGYLAINKSTIERLPLETPETEYPYIFLSRIVHDYLENEMTATLTDILDAIVFETFFMHHMKENDIDILCFVNNDISKVMNKRKLENLGSTEKEKVIKKLHKRWSDPENEVRKRINSFPEKSPDILKPILEG